MNRVARSGLIIAAATSGAVGLATPGYADSVADGVAAHSPGALSGNTVQLPLHVPVNACGNTVNVVGLLNPAVGNSCADESADEDSGYGGDGGTRSAGAVADGRETDSPGLVSGNGAHLPVQLPLNVTGNSVNIVGIGNPTAGNGSSTPSGDRPDRPDTPSAPKTAPPSKHPAKSAKPAEYELPRIMPEVDARTALAATGSELTGPTAAGSAALVLGGVVLFRRFRPTAVQRPRS